MRSCDGSTAFKRLLFDTSAKFSAVLQYAGNTHFVQLLRKKLNRRGSYWTDCHPARRTHCHLPMHPRHCQLLHCEVLSGSRPQPLQFQSLLLGEEGLGRKLEASTTEALPAQSSMHIRQRPRFALRSGFTAKCGVGQADAPLEVYEHWGGGAYRCYQGFRSYRV